MNGCIYRTKDGECELWTDNNHHSFCDENCNDKHPSNADRIRAMSDEKLAEFLATNADCVWCVAKPDTQDCDQCGKVWLDWLRKECET